MLPLTADNIETNPFGMIMSPAIDKITEALVEFQKEYSRISFTAMGYHNNRYADFDTIMDTIRPKLAKHGLVATFPSLPGYDIEKYSEKNKDVVSIFEPFACMILHTSGQWIGSICTLPLNKDNNAQGYGGSKTYSKRFLLTGLLGITCGEPDDDGAFASGLTEKLETTPFIETKPTEKKPAELPKEKTETVQQPDVQKQLPVEEKKLNKVEVSINTMSDEELDKSAKEVEAMMNQLP
jgi:hypothetical protein